MREKKRVAGEYGESSSSVESRTVVRDQQKFLFSQAHFHHILNSSSSRHQ